MFQHKTRGRPVTTVPAVHLMIPANSICLDVLVDDLLNGSVGDKLLESAVDLVDHFGVALGECHSVILGGVLGVEDAESFVSLYEFFCGLVVDDDGVDLVLRAMIASAPLLNFSTFSSP